MPSPNLAIAHVAAAQNQKEVTINDAVDALDLALTGTLALDLAAGHAAPSAAALRRAAILQPAGPLAGPATVALPQIRRVLAVRNSDAGFAITLQRGATAVALAPGETAIVLCDGTANGLARAGAGAPVYDFGMAARGTPEPGAVLGTVVPPRTVLLPPDLAGSVAHADSAPEAPFAIALTRNASPVATITLAPDGSTAMVTAGGAAIALAPGDVVRFLAPATADPAIAAIAVTLAGWRLA